MRWLGALDAATRTQQVRQALGAHGEAKLIAHVHFGRSLRSRVLAETGGVGGAAMARAAEELKDILRALTAHYQEADRHSRDGIVRAGVAGAGDRKRSMAMAA